MKSVFYPRVVALEQQGIRQQVIAETHTDCSVTYNIYPGAIHPYLGSRLRVTVEVIDEETYRDEIRQPRKEDHDNQDAATEGESPQGGAHPSGVDATSEGHGVPGQGEGTSPEAQQASATFASDGSLVLNIATSEEVVRLKTAMNDFMKRYISMTLMDLFDMAGVPSKPEHNLVGWRSLQNIQTYRDGPDTMFRVVFPKPEVL